MSRPATGFAFATKRAGKASVFQDMGSGTKAEQQLQQKQKQPQGRPGHSLVEDDDMAGIAEAPSTDEAYAMFMQSVGLDAGGPGSSADQTPSISLQIKKPSIMETGAPDDEVRGIGIAFSFSLHL